MTVSKYTHIAGSSLSLIRISHPLDRARWREETLYRTTNHFITHFLKGEVSYPLIRWKRSEELSRTHIMRIRWFHSKATTISTITTAVRTKKICVTSERYQWMRTSCRSGLCLWASSRRSLWLTSTGYRIRIGRCWAAPRWTTSRARPRSNTIDSWSRCWGSQIQICCNTKR